MEINEVKIGDKVSFQHKKKTVTGKVIYRHDDKKMDKASLMGHVNVEILGDKSYPVTVHVSKLRPVPALKEEITMEHVNEDIHDLIDHIENGNNIEAEQVFHSIMQNKIDELLNASKIEVAQEMFNSHECAECDEEIDEALKGKQHKIDANKNGKIDAQDFKMLRAKKGMEEEVESLDEISTSTLMSAGKKRLKQAHDLVKKDVNNHKAALKIAARGDALKKYAAKKANAGMKEEAETTQEAYSDPYAAKKAAEMKKAHAATMADAKKEFEASKKPKFAKNFMKMKKEEVEQMDEVITKSTPTGEVISDFVHSKNPKFAGKSKKERIRMALGAKYAMMRKGK